MSAPWTVDPADCEPCRETLSGRCRYHKKEEERLANLDAMSRAIDGLANQAEYRDEKLGGRISRVDEAQVKATQNLRYDLDRLESNFERLRRAVDRLERG